MQKQSLKEQVPGMCSKHSRYYALGCLPVIAFLHKRNKSRSLPKAYQFPSIHLPSVFYELKPHINHKQSGYYSSILNSLAHTQNKCLQKNLKMCRVYQSLHFTTCFFAIGFKICGLRYLGLDKLCYIHVA